jgi:hypothetical protein
VVREALGHSARFFFFLLPAHLYYLPYTFFQYLHSLVYLSVSYLLSPLTFSFLLFLIFFGSLSPAFFQLCISPLHFSIYFLFYLSKYFFGKLLFFPRNSRRRNLEENAAANSVLNPANKYFIPGHKHRTNSKVFCTLVIAFCGCLPNYRKHKNNEKHLSTGDARASCSAESFSGGSGAAPDPLRSLFLHTTRADKCLISSPDTTTRIETGIDFQ